MTVINLVTPKAAVKQEFLFNKPDSVKSSSLAAALGVAKFISHCYDFVVLLKSILDVQRTYLWSQADNT
jgi:hypothetical protein